MVTNTKATLYNAYPAPYRPVTESDMTTERIIKKYANRRLYDTAENRYIALDAVRLLVKNGSPFKIVDAQSGEDITRSILLQIIVEQEKNGNPILSTELLQQIIRFYGDTLQSLVGTYLEKSFETFTRQQQIFNDHMENILQNTPRSVFTEMTEKNLEMWQQMQKGFMQAFGVSPADSNSENHTAPTKDD